MKRNVFARLAVIAGTLATASFIATTANAQSATPEIPAWLNKISFSGDIMLRAQHTNNNTAIDQMGYYRARLATTAKISEQLTANFRITSGYNGGSTPNTLTSSLQPATEGFSKKGIWLDITSLDYKPMDGMTLTAGKMMNPLFKAGGAEVVWDNDVNPEGVSVKYALDLGAFKPFINAAHFIIQDNTTASVADMTLAAAQIGTAFKGESLTANIAVSSYNYNNLKDATPIYFTSSGAASGKGNTTASSKYVYEYKITEIEADASADVWGLPVMAFGGALQNSEPSTLNRGAFGGLRLGKIADAGSWSITYSYRDLDADATVAAFTDGDQAGSVTSSRGNKVSFAYSPVKNVTTTMNAAFMNYDVASTNKFWERYTLDVAASF